jgi:hypothetical protein
MRSVMPGYGSHCAARDFGGPMFSAMLSPMLNPTLNPMLKTPAGMSYRTGATARVYIPAGGAIRNTARRHAETAGTSGAHGQSRFCGGRGRDD